MPDANFAHPRLASVYDAFDGARDDLNAYRTIVKQLGARTVLDVGCGTGCLAHLLAHDGITVVALDPAEASLEVARAKDGSDAVTWIHGDTSSLPPLDVDLAVMTGNAAQVFITDEDWAATLRRIRTALRRQGYFVFETRRPDPDRPTARFVPLHLHLCLGRTQGHVRLNAAVPIPRRGRAEPAVQRLQDARCPRRPGSSGPGARFRRSTNQVTAARLAA